ncbi:hypothetical protein JCM3766R1_000959 [Sporobolomyces carnicolor]
MSTSKGAPALSLEPLAPFANDGKDSQPFARPARLADVNLQDGSEVYTRNDPRKSLPERLVRVWAERGDYSLVTEDKIRNSSLETTQPERDRDEADERPSPDRMRQFAESMLNNLTVARGELSTALDLLNVLSPATEPPNVDPNTIPLAHETLALVPTAVPPPAPLADPTSDTSLASLVLAESLASIKHNARLFFAASEDLIPLGQDEGTNHESEGGGEGERSKNRTSSAAPPTAKSPDPWPTILSLHANSPARSLVPLGAVAGASLTGRNEARSARQVGVFYGFEEAAREFRRASVATVAELVSRDVERRGGRQLEVEMSSPSSDLVESEIWGRQRRRPRQRPRGEDIDREDEDGEGDDEDEGSVEAILTKRNRSAFAEELFAKLVSEAKRDPTLGARYTIATATRGESIELDRIGRWRLKLSMVSPSTELRSSSSSTTTTTDASPVRIISPLLRLLFLGEYASRRRRRRHHDKDSSSLSSRPLLATVATLLRYLERIESVRKVLERVQARFGSQVEVELSSREQRLVIGAREREREEDSIANLVREISRDVVEVIEGNENELGGRALVRLNKRHAFHILFSVPLPTATRGTSSSSSDLSTTTTATATAAGKRPGSSGLTLRSPGKSQAVAMPTVRHLEEFLDGELNRVLQQQQVT